MAKDITMKRYDATINSQTNAPIGWVDLYPKTKAGNLYASDGTTPLFDNSDKLQADYIDLATSVVGSGTNASKPVTSGAVDSAITTATENLTAIAEGKTKTFVTDLVEHTESDVTSYYIMAQASGDAKAVGTNIQYSTAGLTPVAVTDSTNSLDFSDYFCWYCVEEYSGTGNNKYYKITYVMDCGTDSWVGASSTSGDIHTGDNLLITNTNVPDYWFTGDSPVVLSKLETTKVDLSSYQLKVAKLGSTTQPLYTSAAGTFTTCSTYAGGTAVTLNGTSKAASTASFYAPTGSGDTNQVLISSGANSSPTWTSTTDTYTATGNGVFNQAGAYGIWSNTVHTSGDQTISGTKTFANTGVKITGVLGSTNYYNILKGNNSLSADATITLPASTGTLALQSELNTTYLSAESSAPSNPITGDVWFVYTS